MPLTITIPGRDLYDPATNRFLTFKEQTVKLEFSLLSISKWEMKWHKPYLSQDQKSVEESVDFLHCMCLTPNVDPKIFYGVDEAGTKAIADYITDPMTATTFHNLEKKHSREIVTNELIYFWMTNFGIPFDPCEKWHLNRLMTLIQVAALKNQPPKKMGMGDIMKQNTALNAARRARLHTHG